MKDERIGRIAEFLVEYFDEYSVLTFVNIYSFHRLDPFVVVVIVYILFFIFMNSYSCYFLLLKLLKRIQ